MSAVRGQTAKVCGVLTNCGEYSVYLGRSYSILTPEGESYYIDGSAADDSGMDCSADRIQDYVPLEGDQVLTLTWEIDLRGCEVAVVEAEPGEPGNSKWVARICKNHFDCLNRVYTSSGSADGITTFTIGQAQVFVDAAAPESSGDAGVNDMRPVTNDN